MDPGTQADGMASLRPSGSVGQTDGIHRRDPMLSARGKAEKMSLLIQPGSIYDPQGSG